MLVMCVGMMLLDSDLRITSIAADAGDVCWQSDARHWPTQLMLVMFAGGRMPNKTCAADADDARWACGYVRCLTRDAATDADDALLLLILGCR